MDAEIAIVGGGASGVLAAIHLLRTANRPMRIVLFERSPTIGDGIAYGTRREEHVLNVIASRMSAFEDDPGHFVRHLSMPTRQAPDPRIGASFAQRRVYGAYLRSCLDDVRRFSPASLEIVHDDVVTLAADTGVELIDRSCRKTVAQAAILALGNWPRALPSACDGGSDAMPVLHAWDFDAIAAIGRDESVTIVGSGLSMVDTVLTLAANRHRAPIQVISRHALFPLPHARHGGAPVDPVALARLPLSNRVALLRLIAAALEQQGDPWQWVMDAVRPHVSTLWRTLGPREQRRFLRHAVRMWDVHRHRIAPDAAAVVDRLRRSGQLVALRGRVVGLRAGAGHWTVSLCGPGDVRRRDVVTRRIVNGIGMQLDLGRVRDVLVGSLLEHGVVRAGPHGIGIDTADDGAVIGRDGSTSRSVYAIGSARIGSLWESIAIPELRVQAAALASRLTRRDPHARPGLDG